MLFETNGFCGSLILSAHRNHYVRRFLLMKSISSKELQGLASQRR